MRIIAVGWFGHSNAGDEAFRLVMEDLFSPRTVRALPIQPVSDQLLDQFKDSDLVIVGGGGIFNYGPCQPFANFSDWIDAVDTPILVLGVGVSPPIFGARERKNMQLLLMRSEKVCVRDYVSKAELDWLNTGVRVDVQPDLAMLLRDAHPSERYPFHRTDSIQVGVSIRQRWWSNRDEAAQSIARAFDRISSTSDVRFVFVPMSTDDGVDDDRVMHRKIISRMRTSRVTEIGEALNPIQIRDLLSGMDLVVSDRLHALVFAFSSGTPGVGIESFSKIRRFMEWAGQQEYVIRTGNDLCQELTDRMMTLIERRAVERRRVKEASTKMKQDLKNYVSTVVRDLASLSHGRAWEKVIPRDLTLSIADCEAIVESNPGHLAGWFKLGKAYEGEGRLDAAIHAYSMAALVEPNNLMAHYLLAVLQNRKGMILEASEECRKVIDLGGAYYLLSLDYAEQWRSQEQLVVLDSQISRVQRRVQFLEKDMETISQSLIFRALRFATSHIDRTFPDGTKRGALRRTVIAKLHAVADKGHFSSVEKDKQIARSELREIQPPPTAVRERQYARWLEANNIDQVRSAESEPRLGYDVILFPIIDWDFRYQRPQQICMQFAENGHRVFYLKTVFEVRPGDPSRSPRVSQITKNVYEVTLACALSLTNTHKAATEGITDRDLVALAESMDELIHEYGIVSALCLAEFPVWTPLLEKLKAKYGWRIVHDCLDRYRGFSNIGNVAISLEEKLSRMSDLVFASSLPIHEEQKLLNAKTVLVRNAADFEHFNNKPREEDPEIRRLFERIRASGTRVVGYYGAIADWFDVELMKHVATSRPEWQFVLIGSTALSDVSPLVGMRNVHLLGEQPYSKLPQFLHGFDACVIPFLTGSLTEAVNPTKVYEYLSAGKPVVAVALPELSELAGLVYTANDPVDFVEKLEQAMGEDSESLRKKRIEFARQNTWETRFATIDETIRNLYPRVTIVVVTRNNLNLIRTCLRSIFAYTEYPNYEIVLVDNASNDGTVEYLTELRKEYSELKLLLQTENASFARAVNTAIESSSGEYIAILNDDVVVTRGWLTRLVQHLCDDRSIGLIGASTDFAGNEAMLRRKFSRIAELQQFAFEFYWENLGMLLPLRTLAMFCIVIPKRVVEKVGSLDETFSTGMFEDDDYSYRVRLNGLRTLCAGDVFIHHVGKVSFRKLSDDKYRKIFQDNRVRFEEKWKMSWIPHTGGLDRRNEIILRSHELERILRKDESLTRTAVLLPVFTTERRSEFAEAFVRQGFRVILVRNAEEPQSKDGFETVAPNVYAYSGPLEVLERIDRPVVVVAERQTQNLVFFRNPIVLYDCSRDGELASDVVGRRSDMLERADLVLVDGELQLSRISKERPDAVLCAGGSDMERIIQNRLLAGVQTHSD